MLRLRDIIDARKIIKGGINKTPILSFDFINKIIGADIYFKAENLQRTGSFKIRGILNKFYRLSFRQKKQGVVGMSVGDHAISLAFVASLFRVPCVAVIPRSAKKNKIKEIRKLGAKVIFKDRDLWAECLRLQHCYGLIPFHPFNDPLIIAGHGTIGLEILNDLPDVKMIFVPVGGGGLISGIAAAVKLKNPKIRVVGVGPIGAPAMFKSVAANRIIRLQSRETIADGLAAPSVDNFTLAHVKKYVDDLVLVSDKEIIRALKMVLEKGRLLSDPSGAAAFAAILSRKISIPSNFKAVCVLSGGNINMEELKGFLKLRN